MVSKEVNEEVNIPLPEPLVDLAESWTVGKLVVPHTTPLAETSPPPSEVIFPPELTEFPVVLSEISIVVKTAKFAGVVNMISFPYPVPLLFVA